MGKLPCKVPLLDCIKIPSTSQEILSPAYIDIAKGEVLAVVSPASEQNIVKLVSGFVGDGPHSGYIKAFGIDTRV